MQKKTFPDFVPPMMAQSAKEAFDSPDWIFEIKLDGYRAITVFDAAGKPHLWSRNGLPLEQKFPAILKAVSRLKLRSTVLGGEIVAVDENGIPRFQLLQRFQKQPTAPTLYFVFDVLGPTEQTLPGRLSWNVERCWKPSSNQWPAFSLGIMSRVKAKHSSNLPNRKAWKA
jgi:bifunctional non-homologous end joining protein LigD